jgi:glucosamine--fructose-6-phosphate aminotransferase (isomerizing)
MVKNNEHLEESLMCGIVGAVAQRDVTFLLIDGLKRLEYRGYDSAGVAIIDANQHIQRRRAEGKVCELGALLKVKPFFGTTGIAHTRWATHGKPNEQNAHPHMSGDDLALVHNGIIENHESLRAELIEQGYAFASETDSETAAHLIHQQLASGNDFLTAVQAIAKKLEGAFAIGFIRRTEPGRLIGLRRGSPLVVGLGTGENFIASDQLALLPVAQKFIYLEEGDVADVRRDQVIIYNAEGDQVERTIHHTELSYSTTEKGKYRHFMLKEIFEQAHAVLSTLEARVTKKQVLVESFGRNAVELFKKVRRIQIVACGTSYHAGLVARYWLEALAGVACQVEIASEFRYRKPVVEADTLFVTLSQSGETADTLGALRLAKTLPNYLSTLAICNVSESSLVRESELVLMTRAGPEVGVASTKAFTTQLTALLLLTIAISHCQQRILGQEETALIEQLNNLPEQLEQILKLAPAIERLAKRFTDKQHALFLGRGIQFPIALEGALKLKEISYIHAEAYPAGELKHGPLALVDADMPVIVLAPQDEWLDKLKSNIQEVRARGGDLIVFADHNAAIEELPGLTVIPMPSTVSLLAPIVYTIPLQLLAYYVAVLKGTDVDQPRNLAKSVTVE